MTSGSGAKGWTKGMWLEPLSGLRGRDLLSVTDLSADELRGVMALAGEMKRDLAPWSRSLEGKQIVLLFEKPSLRTRLTFEVGVAKLGGTALYVDHAHSRIGERESVRDYGRNLERWLHGIVARVFSQRVVEELASAAGVPVINGLSEMYHPCQAMADVFTLGERLGELRGRRVVYIGDGNNVCHSLMHAAAMLGMHVTAITPEGREPKAAEVAWARGKASAFGVGVEVSNDPADVRGADAVYTDVWVSMGDAKTGDTGRMFEPYRVDAGLMELAGPRSIFMHCLPAKRGEEVTDEVMDSSRSVVFDQAENRMHVQNAWMVGVMGV